jgi:hypothetical protein
MTRFAHKHTPPPADVCLLLRAHAEASWLSHEVVPVLRELEREDRSRAQTEASFVYLDVLWKEALERASDTDAAREKLNALAPNGNHRTHSRARRYDAAVRRLRDTVGQRMAQLIEASPADAAS